jgi:threonine dehydratase
LLPDTSTELEISHSLTQKLSIEPSAAVGVAVAISEKFRNMYPNVRNVGIVLCGGNVDPETVESLLQ